ISPSLMNLFTTVDPRPIHFMGIAGAGMSGLALLAKEQGVTITGCDNDPAGAADLAAIGVEIWRGHDPGHVAGARAVVVTAAVPGDHPELTRARALGVPVVRRADALSQAVAGGTVVAVAGTHGKTTTTVMVTEALAAAGRDPTGLAGGRGRADYGARARRARLDGTDRGAWRGQWAGPPVHAAAASTGAPQRTQRGRGARGRVRAGGGYRASARGARAVHRRGAPVRAGGRRARRDGSGRLRAPSHRGASDARGGAPGVPAAACGGGVSAAPVLADGA